MKRYSPEAVRIAQGLAGSGVAGRMARKLGKGQAIGMGKLGGTLGSTARKALQSNKIKK